MGEDHSLEEGALSGYRGWKCSCTGSIGETKREEKGRHGLLMETETRGLLCLNHTTQQTGVGLSPESLLRAGRRGGMRWRKKGIKGVLSRHETKRDCGLKVVASLMNDCERIEKQIKYQ